MKVKSKRKTELDNSVIQFQLFTDDTTVVVPMPSSAKQEIACAVQELVTPKREKRFVLQSSHLCMGSDDEKVKANLAAIEIALIKNEFSYEDKVTLSAYCGWGGLSKFFDENNSRYEEGRKSLKSLVSSHWYEMAKESVLTAYYTEPDIIRSIWNMLRGMGFKGGKVLEPSSGTGHFISAMPEDLREASSVTAIEIDPLTARIASAIIGDETCQVIARGIEDAGLRTDMFDVVVGNVPFGNFSIHDKKFAKLKLPIHDYFFAKAIDVVRPGGVIALITSSGTLDKGSSKFREYMQERADFVCAVRLPSGAFDALGGTDVVTDLIVLRKKPSESDAMQPAAFENLVEADADMKVDHDESHEINEYFVNHPAMVMGKLSSRSGPYGRVETVKPNAEWKSDFARLAKHQSLNGWYVEGETKSGDIYTGNTGIKSAMAAGYFFGEDGSLQFIDNGVVEDQSSLPLSKRQRIEAITRIRDSAAELLEIEATGRDGAGLRVVLNRQYDEFVKQYGPLMKPFNRRAFSSDSHAPLVWSLETYDDETESVIKSDLFSKPTVGRSSLESVASSISDAIALSYNKYARLDFDFMAKALDKSPTDILNELESLNRVYFDPEKREYSDSEVYLSGKVREKLAQAQEAMYEDSRFEKNVKALEAVVPPLLPLKDVSIRLGVSWIPASDVQDFVRNHLGFKTAAIVHSKGYASWAVNVSSGFKSDLKATNDWGTVAMPFNRILSCLLNQTQPTVHADIESFGEGGAKSVKTVVDKEETIAAREIGEKLQNEFEKWIYLDEPRVARLEQIYNLTFNGTVNRVYNGSHLVIPGLNTDINLRDAQLDSVWRGLVSGNTLYALAVGGGKTLIQICLAQECKRLGIANKPWLVVPNHMLEAFAGEYMRAFPRAKILAASKADMEGDKRRHLMMRAATGDWDAVIITHSSFGKIRLSQKALDQYAEEIIDAAEEAIQEAGTDRNTVRAAQMQKKMIESKINSLAGGEKDSGVLPFEQLGCDMVLVDESDLFKNLAIQTKKKNVAGISGGCSARAFDMFIKTRVIAERRGYDGFGVVYSTATPISNSIAELFVVQLTLQHDRLREMGLDNFDAWSANFAREVTSIEVTPEGAGFRMHTRFAQFVNVPELLLLFKEVAEIRTKKMLNLPEPKLFGDKHIIVTAKASESQVEFVQSLVSRAKAIRNGSVKPNEDNMLSVTNDGRKAALDMRIIDSLAMDDLNSKVNKCVANVFKHWVEGADKKLTQLVFCDLSTPKKKGIFSVYQHVKDSLIALGVPAEQIAFAQDYTTDLQKTALHRKVRNGSIRILIGSTELMGFGTNVQDLLVAEHHIDPPWRPRDVEQRDGRIIRQGNTNEIVYVYRYVTEGTFDAYMWQGLERKAGFIAQIMEGGLVARIVEDVTSQALSYAEVKALASGNPLVVQKAGIDAEVSKLWAVKSSWLEGRSRLRGRLRSLEINLESHNSFIKKVESDINHFGAHDVITIKGNTMNPSKETGKAVMSYLAGIKDRESLKFEMNPKKGIHYKTIDDIMKIGNVRVQGLLTIGENYYSMDLYAIGGSDHRYHFSMPYGAEKISEFLANAELLNQLKTNAQQTREWAELAKAEIAEIEIEMKRPFEHEARLQVAIEKQKEIDDALDINTDDNAALTMDSQS